MGVGAVSQVAVGVLSTIWSGDLQVMNKVLSLFTLLFSYILIKIRQDRFEITSDHINPETRRNVTRPDPNKLRLLSAVQFGLSMFQLKPWQTVVLPTECMITLNLWRMLLIVGYGLISLDAQPQF